MYITPILKAVLCGQAYNVLGESKIGLYTNSSADSSAKSTWDPWALQMSTW